jgi:hypothetical protein
VNVPEEVEATPDQELECMPEDEPPPVQGDIELQHQEFPVEENRKNENDEESEGSDEDDNIVVTVPPPSQQSLPGYRYEGGPGSFGSNHQHQDWELPPEKSETINQSDTPTAGSHHHFNNNSSSGSNNNNNNSGSYEGQHKPPNTYQIENLNKGFPPSVMNNPQGSYRQQMYASHPQQQPPNVHGPPSHHPQFPNHGHRYPSGMPMHPQSSNYYGPPQQK